MMRAGNYVRRLRNSRKFCAICIRCKERIKLLQEELATVVNEQNNRSLFVLTIVTVLALPINLTAGLMGMNVGGIPFAQNEYGFWIVVLMLAIATGIAAWLAFRRRDPDA
jgi:zinc transporter